MSDDEQTRGNRDQDDRPSQLVSMVDSLTADLTIGSKIIGDGKNELVSEHPVAVVDYYISINKNEWAKETYLDYSYDLTRLLEYCQYANIEDLTELSSSDLEGFRQWRERDEYIKLVTIDAQLSNIRVFIRWAERMELVERGLADGIEMPDLEISDEVSYQRLSPEHANQIIQYHSQFDYVTRSFAEFVLMWEGLCRRGDVRAIDLEDYDREEGTIELKHRPEEDTPLKNQDGTVNGEGGERIINLPDWVCEIINAYIDGTGDPQHPQRIDSQDSYGRNPLFTTTFGRVSKSTVQRDIYRITQPCRINQECPHGKNPETCEWRNNNDVVSKCESSVSPHPVRRGGICNQIDEEVDKDTISGEADVSREVLDKHYDLRSKEEARQQRREDLKRHLDGYDRDTDQGELSRVYAASPLMTDVARIKTTYRQSITDHATRNRMVKGLGGYACLVLLLALNFVLMGVNPIA